MQLPSGDEYPLNLIIGEASIMVYYLNQSNLLFTYDIDYNSGVTCAAAVLRQKNQSINPSSIILSFYFALSLSNYDLVDMKVVINLQFNSLTSMYDFTGFAQVVSSYPPLSFPASAMLIVNNVVFIQNIHGITAFDALNAAVINVDPAISWGNMRSVIYKDSRWIMLQDSSLFELKLVNGTGNLPSFVLGVTIAVFPSKLYSLVYGNFIDLVYVSGEALVY